MMAHIVENIWKKGCNMDYYCDLVMSSNSKSPPNVVDHIDKKLGEMFKGRSYSIYSLYVFY